MDDDYAYAPWPPSPAFSPYGNGGGFHSLPTRYGNVGEPHQQQQQQQQRRPKRASLYGGLTLSDTGNSTDVLSSLASGPLFDDMPDYDAYLYSSTSNFIPQQQQQAFHLKQNMQTTRFPPTPQHNSYSSYSNNYSNNNNSFRSNGSGSKQQQSVAMKNFQQKFKEKEKAFGYAVALAFARDHLCVLPEKQHGKVYLEMAELSRKYSDFDGARQWYVTACTIKSSSAQPYVERAKMEEEIGCIHIAGTLLHQGLKNVTQEHTNNVLSKLIKHEERVGNIKLVRRLLAQVDASNWKTILEGALFESRQLFTFKQTCIIFEYLMASVPNSGPVIFEYVKFLEKEGCLQKAVDVAFFGVQNNSRYGPLWFLLLNIKERRAYLAAKRKAKQGLNYLDKICKVKFGVDRITSDTTNLLYDQKDINLIEDIKVQAVSSLSHELSWKVQFESAQILQRMNALKPAQNTLAESALTCPNNLRWKVWLNAARNELFNPKGALIVPMLLEQALLEAPSKYKSTVLIEMALVLEFRNEIETARQTWLNILKEHGEDEWKVYVEYVVFEARQGNKNTALAAAEVGLQQHVTRGRLWAVAIQVCDDIDKKLVLFKKALLNVPKSGEVWCEGSRLHLDPTTMLFNVQKAERFIKYAIQFTPQYGDSFIEAVKIILLKNDYDLEDELQDMTQQCINADPNYGGLWFACKKHATEPARKVMREARRIMTSELMKFGDVYRTGRCQKDEVDFSSAISSFNWMKQHLDVLPLEMKLKLLFGCSDSSNTK